MNSTRTLVLTALFVALTAVGTSLGIRGTTGYYHLGDGIFYSAALLLGAVPGAVAGGLGGAIVDVLAGSALPWAPITLIVKGLTGLVIGSLARGDAGVPRRLLALALGALVTIVGYGIATWTLYGWPAALGETYGNILQTLVGIVIALVLMRVLARPVAQFQRSA